MWNPGAGAGTQAGRTKITASSQIMTGTRPTPNIAKCERPGAKSEPVKGEDEKGNER